MNSRFRSWVGNLALLLAAIVFALLLAEIAFRITGQRMVFPQMFVEDAHTVYRLKPNVHVRTIHAGYFDYEYTVNSQGLRGVADVVARGPRKRGRILFLGDSFTFGVGVDDSATYPARVETRLRQWCDALVEAVNGGVGGFGTSHELSFLQHYGWQFAPDIVVLGFMIGDPEDNSLRGLHRLVNGRLEEIPASERPGWGLIRAHKHVPGYNWLVQHSTLFNWTRLKVGSLAAQRADAGEAARAPDSSAADESAEMREHERWKLTAALIDSIRAQTESHGARLVVAIIPHEAALSAYYADGRDGNVDRIVYICREQQLACVNAAESIRRSRPMARPGSFYLREGHFNAAGYDLLAEALATRLADELKCTKR